MNKIFQNRLREFMGRIDQAIRAKPIEGATNTKELINLLHNKKSNIILFPSNELTNLVDSPCPVKNPASQDSKVVIRSFKQLRDFFDRNEAFVCRNCPKQESCADKFKIPNSKFNAGTRDVFQVLLAFADKASHLETMSADKISEDQLADDQSLTPEQEQAAEQYKLYGLKMKDALVVLQALDGLVTSKLEKDDYLEEKFTAAIGLYENEMGIDKYSVDMVERKNGRIKKFREDDPSEKEIAIQKENRIQERDAKLRNSFPSKLPKGELSEKQRNYLKKFDDNVSTKPIPDSGSRQLPKKRVRGGDSYIDSVKKQASTTVSGHFLKEFKRPPYQASKERETKRWNNSERRYPKEENDGLSAESGERRNFTKRIDQGTQYKSSNRPSSERYTSDRARRPKQEEQYRDRKFSKRHENGNFSTFGDRNEKPEWNNRKRPSDQGQNRGQRGGFERK